jgi:hypothetical protein
MHTQNPNAAWIAAGLAASVTLSAATYSEWPNRQYLDVPGPGLIKIGLPAETLDAARGDLADLRLSDDRGIEVAYLLEQATPASKVVRGVKSFKAELEPGATALTLETGLAQPLAAVRLLTPATSFIKAVSVAGSNDGSSWRPLASGQPVFQQPNGANQLRVEVPPGTWAFVRLSLDDRSSAPVPFTGAEVEAANAEPVATEPVDVLLAERGEDPGETRLTLNLGAAHLRLASLEIESPDALFRRRVSLAVRQIEENTVRERVVATDSIYRVSVPGQPASDRLSLPLDLPVPTRELLFRVQNEDSPPLQIRAVRVRRWPVYLVFLAPRPGNYQVYTGNPRCPAPRYDLANQGIDLTTAQRTPIRPGVLQPNPTYRTPETLPQVQDTGASLDAAAWRYRKPVVISQPGVQQLDLDLEVLSGAQPGFADLRLVREGRQLPFIFENTSISRMLRPTVARADDSRQPKVSRWSLTLPQPDLPLLRLSCISPTALFRRDVVLYEEASDARGTRYRRDLGNGSWVQSPDRQAKPFVLTLRTSPQTDRVFLEVRNEDNPAIELADFEFAWPVTRLFFKTTSAANVFLLYGNRSARTPQYDLSLVANQLLMADKSTALLGVQEQLRHSAWGEGRTPGRGGWLLWGVLGLVVTALLVIIARLMPKAPPPPGS